MIAGAKRYWLGLSGRERGLLGGLAALLIAVAGYYGVIAPISTARAQAQADIRRYEMLAARVLAAGALLPPNSQGQVHPGTPVEGAQAAAQSAALTVALVPNGDGASGTFDDVSYDAALNWIAGVERTTVLRAHRVELAPGKSDGLVRGSVEFRP